MTNPDGIGGTNGVQTRRCPGCNGLQTIQRPEIGAFSTLVCDRCYYERFCCSPSEEQYFARHAAFWEPFAPKAQSVDKVAVYYDGVKVEMSQADADAYSKQSSHERMTRVRAMTADETTERAQAIKGLPAEALAAFGQKLQSICGEANFDWNFSDYFVRVGPKGAGFMAIPRADFARSILAAMAAMKEGK